MKKLLVLVLMIVFASCGESKSDKKSQEKATELIKEESTKIENQVSITIEAIVLIDDVFEIYYYEPGYDSFTSKDFVSIRVKGSTEMQKIKFLLPKRIYPERLRLDFGKNKNQKQIKLKGVKLGYGAKKYSFSKEELISLRPSKFIDYDSNEFAIIPKVIDNKYDPYFYTQKVNSIIDYLLED